jgi:uncharacterized protein (TIGR02284 family)
VDAVASTLNGLVRTCKDGENGFRTAAENVEDPNLRRLFESYSQQRAEFAAELQMEVERLAQKPADDGHVTAAFHRGLMDLKGGLAGRDEGSIISECERGEDAALKVYDEALGIALSPELRGLIERQYRGIREAHDQIRSLEQIHNRHS